MIFRGEHAFLSNFHVSPFQFNGTAFNTVENAYQAAKATNVDDFNLIAQAGTPTQAKHLSYTIKIREDWDDVRNSIMMMYLMLKFSKGSELLAKLEATEDIRHDNMHHDNYWGNCLCHDCSDKPGKDVLGTLLVLVKD